MHIHSNRDIKSAGVFLRLALYLKSRLNSCRANAHRVNLADLVETSVKNVRGLWSEKTVTLDRRTQLLTFWSAHCVGLPLNGGPIPLCFIQLLSSEGCGPLTPIHRSLEKTASNCHRTGINGQTEGTLVVYGVQYD